MCASRRHTCAETLRHQDLDADGQDERLARGHTRDQGGGDGAGATRMRTSMPNS